VKPTKLEYVLAIIFVIFDLGGRHLIAIPNLELIRFCYLSFFLFRFLVLPFVGVISPIFLNEKEHYTHKQCTYNDGNKSEIPIKKGTWYLDACSRFLNSLHKISSAAQNKSVSKQESNCNYCGQDKDKLPSITHKQIPLLSEVKRIISRVKRLCNQMQIKPFEKGGLQGEKSPFFFLQGLAACYTVSSGR